MTTDGDAASRDADGLIRAGLRGERPPWPDRDGSELCDLVLDRCDIHGVAPLLYNRIGQGSGWPRTVLERLRDRGAAAAIHEAHRERILAGLLAKLAARGIEPVLLKGSALAHTLYDEPALRVRSDTDLLIPPHARAEADAVLRSLGFDRLPELEGELISYQAGYKRHDALGLPHAIDLHWRINNSQVLSRLFSHAELRARAVPVPALGADARGACRVDSLLIACMHRQVHASAPYWVAGTAHFSADRLIWLYDLHLLAARMGPAEWSEAVRLAHEKGLAALCRDGLARAARMLGTALPPGVLQSLDPGRRHEAPQVYLRAGAVRQELMNFRAVDGLAAKVRFLGELAFPPPAYMRARFAGVRPGWLPWLYLRRGLAGLSARLARYGAAGRREP